MAKILFIDDDPDIRPLMRITLTKLGHKPSLAARGEEGLRLAKSEAFDLIVVDLIFNRSIIKLFLYTIDNNF